MWRLLVSRNAGYSLTFRYSLLSHHHTVKHYHQTKKENVAFAQRISAWHLPLLLVAGCLVAASLVSLWKPGLSDDFSLRTLAGSNGEEFEQLEAFMQQFSGVELALVVVKSEKVLSPKTQKCLKQIVEQAKELPAVSGAASISQASSFFRPLLADSRIVRGLLVSEEGTAAAVLLRMRDDHDVSGVPRSKTVASLKRIVAEATTDHPGHEIVLTGPYVVSSEMTHLVWTDLVTFGLLGAVVALLVLSLSLGSARLAFYPLCVGLATIVLILGLSVRLEINTALNLPMLVLLSAVLTVANCVHLAVGHDEQRGDAAATIRRLWRPCCGVVATTIVGFAAVGMSALQPVRSFALLMVLGLSIGLLLALVGACRSLKTPTDHGPPTRALLSGPIGWLLKWTLGGVRRFPGAIVGLFLLLGVGSACLTANLEYNLRFLDNFRPDDEIRRNYEFAQESLAPMQSYDMLIERVDGQTPVTVESIDAIRQLSEEYEGKYPIARSVSINDFLTFGGAKLPKSNKALEQRVDFMRSSLLKILGEDPLALFIGKEPNVLRVSFLAQEGPSAEEKIALGNQLRDQTQQILGEKYKVKVTGLYYFYSHVAQELLRDQLKSLVASVVGLFVTMAFVLGGWRLGSWRLALIGMAPPLFAGASCVGLMALLHVPFNTVTSMMIAVALGIAVDDTIHYLWRYQVNRRRGHSVARSIIATQLTVGKACILTSLVIAAGFAVMGFSRFLPIAYFGCVISAVMAIALAANILFLPALVLVVDGVREKVRSL